MDILTRPQKRRNAETTEWLQKKTSFRERSALKSKPQNEENHTQRTYGGTEDKWVKIPVTRGLII